MNSHIMLIYMKTFYRDLGVFFFTTHLLLNLCWTLVMVCVYYCEGMRTLNLMGWLGICLMSAVIIPVLCAHRPNWRTWLDVGPGPL